MPETNCRTGFTECAGRLQWSRPYLLCFSNAASGLQLYAANALICKEKDAAAETQPARNSRALPLLQSVGIISRHTTGTTRPAKEPLLGEQRRE